MTTGMKKLSIFFGTIIFIPLLSFLMQSFKAEPKNMNRLIDLSHVIEDGMITYKGLPAPIICDYLSREDSKKRYEAGTEFQIGKIEMVSNTGTYIDCPFHRYADGQDLSEVTLE